MRTLVFLCLVLLDICSGQQQIIVHSNPLKDPYICGLPTCHYSNSTNKFHYGPNKYWTYKYSIEARSLFSGTSKNESTMFVEAQVGLTFSSPCDGVLAISDVKLSEQQIQDGGEVTNLHVDSSKFDELLKEFDLRFEFKDGVINEICPKEEEQPWAINFKRGLLSMLQNNMRRLDLDYNGVEKDVQGTCQTFYNVLGPEGTSLLIEKIKDLASCSGRAKFNSVIQMEPITSFQFKSKNREIVKSTSKCTLSVDHNVYNSITCEESYLLEPFSNKASGASTTVVRKLVLVSEGNHTFGVNQDEITKRTTLKFDHSIPLQPSSTNINNARDLLKQLCKESHTDTYNNLADLFGKSIHKLRALSYAALTTLYSHSKITCDTAKKHLLDSLPYIHTSGSVALMKDILLKEPISEEAITNWLLSISFTPRPDENMLQSTLELLQARSERADFALSIASMTHTYCTQNDHCREKKVVDSIVRYFEDILKNMTKKPTTQYTREEEEKIIVTLKSLGTIGEISEDFKAEIFKLIEDSTIDASLRLAAVESFRRSPCERTRDYFQDIYETMEEDTEVRIASYLQMMKCPDYMLVRKIAHNLNIEEVNQVGSFIWSHLHNLAKTADPFKLEIQSLISEDELVKKFSTDIRKFSHNRDGSLFFDDYNFGGNYETNIIFSPSSYIPKTGMLNLTVDIFGESINLLELNTRIEGFESYLENFFGPKGKSNILKEKMEDLKMRWARDVKENELSSVDKKVEEVKETENIRRDPKVSLGVKIFGNDLKYSTFNGDQEIMDALQKFNLLNQLKKILSGKEINYNHSSLFLDATYVIPSGTGLPLSLSLIGTSAVSVKVSGSLSAKKFSANKELELVANLEPTASVDISAEMSLSAFYASTGIKLKTNMYTTSSVKGEVKLKSYKLASVKFSMPKNNARLFGARSELLVKQNNVEEPQAGLQVSSVSNSVCSWPPVSETFGLSLCTEYSFINASKMSEAPYFILAGPTDFQIYLTKSDPSANVYLFEYKYTEGRDLSVVSMTFDTPGSSIKRLINANLTIANDNQNLTLFMQSSAGEILARGMLKNNDDQKFLQVALDINNRKHFDMYFSYDRQPKQNGYIYRPKVYLGVNGERVMELQGAVDLISKKDIFQYTVDMKFHTKRLTSKLFGYISKTESSLGSDLHVDYKFQGTKEHRVSLKFSIADRTRRNIAVVIGSCDVQSSGYPQFNFNTNVTYQRSASHLELKVNLLQNPLPPSDPEADFESLTANFVFSYKSFTDSKQTFKAVADVKRPSNNLDLKIMGLYESINSDNNVEFVVNYGDNKQVSIKGFYSHPRTTLEEIRARLNISMPNFTPMTVKVEIIEIQNKNYNLDISGTWFSGHSAHAKGYYHDKSSGMSSSHHLKVFIISPNFEDINSDFQFYRDNHMLKFDLSSVYAKNDYQLYLSHNTTKYAQLSTEFRLKYKNKFYTLNSIVNTGEQIKISAEVHFDQFRDVDFSLWFQNEERQKALGFNINWDANRDPNQKLLVAANWTKSADFNYNADLVASYPGRTILGKYTFLLEKGKADFLSSLSWADGKTFAIAANFIYSYEKEVTFIVTSSLSTPFEQWKNMQLEGRFEHLNNKYSLTSRVFWHPRQKIEMELFGDYTSRAEFFDCRYSCAIFSTLDRIPTINATVKHIQNGTSYDTNVHLMYTKDFMVDVDSKWVINEDKNSSNLTGTVLTKTPFVGFQKGVLLTKMFITNDRIFKGVADWDLDHQKVTINMIGNFKRLIESMFDANFTTPEETYRCQYKLSKKDRHFVALMTYPSGALGTEVLLQFTNFTDFNVKLFAATTLEFLQEALIVGKLKPGEVDFRVGWNHLVLGLSGSWHHTSMIDFDYAYKFYTPLKDFEENGIIVKLILKEGLDFETSVKLSIYKLGIKIVGHPKPKLLKDIGLDTQNYLSWQGFIDLDIMIYPTIHGKMDLDQKGTAYILQTKVRLPHGTATIFDEFDFVDILKMSNNLKILTPYDSFKTITSVFRLNVVQSQQYSLRLGLNYENKTKLTKAEIFAEYNVDRKEVEERSYNLTLKAVSPFDILPKLNLLGIYETEPNYYHAKVVYKTLKSDVCLDATAETDNTDGEWLGITSEYHASTPLVTLPQSELRMTKLFSNSDNYVEVHLKIPEKYDQEVHFRSQWLLKSLTYFKTFVTLETPWRGLENTTVGANFLSEPSKTTFWAYTLMKPVELEVNSTLEDDVLQSWSLIQFQEKKMPVTVSCKILQPSPTDRKFVGNLSLGEINYKISGNATKLGDLPVKVAIDFIPKDGQNPLNFQYDLKVGLSEYNLDGSVGFPGRIVNFSADFNVQDKFDWSLNMEIDPPNALEKTSFKVVTASVLDGVNVDLVGRTEIERLENPKCGLHYRFKDILRKLHGYFEVTKAKGSADIELTWVFLENMLLKAIGRFQNTEYSSESSVYGYFKNPEKSYKYLDVGGNVEFDRIWATGANVTLVLPEKNNVTAEGRVRMPGDDNEIHSIFGKLNYAEGLRFVNYLLKYRSTLPVRKYGNWGQISLENPNNISGNIILEWNGQKIENLATFEKVDQSTELTYKMKSPKYQNKHVFVSKIAYKNHEGHHNVTCKAFSPEDNSIVFGTIDYVELTNMHGMVNISVNYKKINYTGAFFKTETNDQTNSRFINVFWDKETALLDSKCDIKMNQEKTEKNYQGRVLVELPLATRHIANISYQYDKKPKLSTGHAQVNYNNESLLQAKYKSQLELEDDLERDKMHVELENKFMPVGADYTHEIKVPRDAKESSILAVDTKYVHLYHLTNHSQLNLTGEVGITTNQDGQKYILVAKHLNRTVKLLTDYSIKDNLEYKQKSRVELSSDIWFEYDVHVFNKTQNDVFDAQSAEINIAYPRRNLTARGSYNISDAIYWTDVSLIWDPDNKTVQAQLDWRDVEKHRDQIEMILRHPSFEKDISFISTYGYSNSTIDGHLVVDYSPNPEQKITVTARVDDLSRLGVYNYSYDLRADHKATTLYFNCFGHIHWNSTECGTVNFVDYKRSFVPFERSETSALVNFDDKSMEFKKNIPLTGLSSFYSRYGGVFPIYTANVTTNHKQNHTSGKFYVNFDKKLLILNMNITEDGSQSLHIYGMIPDARSARFDIWREYEDKRVTDVFYFLNLNHSRLVMSKLQWRPELISDFKAGLRQNAMFLYYDTLKDINVTRQYVMSEFGSAINGFWNDAKPIVEKYMDDLRNLTTIQDDLQVLQNFLNRSYEANEFYIKDISNMALALFDESAIKSSLQSLPKIFQELWHVMGKSGKNIKESINYVIEKIKLYYAHTTEFIHDLINGDPAVHIQHILQKIVDKYDSYIKEIHVAVLQYMEKLWSDIYDLLVKNWHETLAALEPSFIKFAHYLESFIWTTGKEFLDFLYIRKNKIMESAYFMEFSKFSKDVDRFYKDITGNNTVEAIYKYGNIAWNFVNEKYINHIPFGKEIKTVLVDIWSDLKRLGDIPALKYLITKYDETAELVKYYYKYFQVEYHVHKMIRFVYTKIIEMSVTALEMDNRAREAKTNFVYEPNEGLMLLEQKLPMSWHAFNETPEFQEIPEIKMWYDIYDYFMTTKANFWNFYHDYIVYTNPNEWLPPFKGHAMLMGSNHYVTFDKKYFDFTGNCPYLLTTDFLDRNFTILVSYDDSGKSNGLILILDKTLVSVNLENDIIQINNLANKTLPLQVGDKFLYRDDDILTLETDKEFSLQCNMKFQVCVFEVSGWHYASTAGLWGTYNNEPYDDLTTPKRLRPEDMTDLTSWADSWSIDDRCQTKDFSSNDKDGVKETSREVLGMCNEFFQSKVSDLSNCFSRIPKDNFYQSCVKSFNAKEACRTAIGYIEMCARQDTPLRIPDTCVKCALSNGTQINEGQIVRIQGEEVPQNADVVFIVEAKNCNRDILQRRNFKLIVAAIEEELVALNITENRYSLVVFGGHGVFNQPRSVLVNNEIFTDSKTVLKYFENIPTGQGNLDIYNAILFANKLPFRSGVSRNFVLIPCSNCQERRMEFDYSTVHQFLFENSVTLHILMNNTFENKKRENKVPFGVDVTRAYTKKDARKLEGDTILRKSISLPKSSLGMCFSLALETNGTIFSARHLENPKNAKKLSEVFSKRFAKSAVPKECTECECTAHNTGVSYMECYPCMFPRSNMEPQGYFEEEYFAQ